MRSGSGARFLQFQLIAFVMTFIALTGAVLGLGFMVALPPALTALGFRDDVAALVRIAGLLLLVAFVMGSLSLLYRFGPCREAARWRWITPGSLLATVLWVLASALFSFYVGHLASYDATYGPLGAVAGVMMWFFVTVYVVLLGAELNAELELQTARDSTDGPPQTDRPPRRLCRRPRGTSVTMSGRLVLAGLRDLDRLVRRLADAMETIARPRPSRPI